MFNQVTPGAAGGDPKSELNQFLQKHVTRPLTKTDIVYTVSKFGAQCQAIVKLNCLEGQEYAGHLSHDQKAAEKSAAQQALQANAHLVQAAKAKPAGGVKRPATPATPGVPAVKKTKVDPSQNAAVTAKTELNGLATKISKKVLSKGDTLYQCNAIGSQFQATVQVIVLPGDWAQRAWAGHLCSTKAKAEQSAAEQAVKDIKADAKLMEEAATKKAGKKSGGGGGGGGGGGWDWDKMMEWMEENGWGEYKREAVGTGFVFGTVVEWKGKGKMGWIKPDVKPTHEAAEKRDGKIYLAANDLAEGVDDVKEGQRVKFKVYSDHSGLGAEECTPM
eukprot:TRINITY_DN7213_c0_g1_i1.p1 TRINITY_DN7213_c0_g1~~TRINITY_DN7213_c0_g1_i1.p1  ORF type:complete len:332 (+),score=99.89 TRINITY_DN7213_c0_g1_i1:75-1070(+)